MEMTRIVLSIVDAGLIKSLATEPFEAQPRPARGKFVVLADAEVVIAGREDMQFGRNAGPLQGQVHEDAVFGVGAAELFIIVGRMHKRMGGVSAGMCRAGRMSSLSLAFR